MKANSHMCHFFVLNHLRPIFARDIYRVGHPNRLENLILTRIHGGMVELSRYLCLRVTPKSRDTLEMRGMCDS